MVSRLHFSQELLDEIAGHLHDDVDALHTLSIVSSNFLPVCSELLFYTLRLHPGNLARWHDRIRERPVLTRLFRAVELYLSTLPAVDEQLIIFILDNLSRPNRIKIKNYRGEKLLWANIHIELQKSLEKLIDKPTVRRLEVFNLKDIPFSFFSGITHLQRIKFASSTFAMPRSALRPNPEWESTCSQTPSLETPVRELSISGNQEHYNLVGHRQCPLRNLNLRWLEVDFLPSNVDQVQHLLSGCGQSLRYLYILMRGGSASLRHLAGLQVLQFYFFIMPYLGKEATLRSISGLSSTLSSLQNADDGQSRPRLEKIIIAVTIMPISLRDIPPKVWTDLDSVLGHIQVQTVQIVMTCLSEDRALMPDWAVLLPTFNGSGRLVSNFSDHVGWIPRRPS
ncbi:hypothetical protein BDN72DRAFT_883737 [Pluteus cervinus]|uniref:Uncharacterized protein n=1 Tax=Pluteus cervinus TaxID=181527 RepID=A0ACD3A3C3_9AGAR|nr:hypothetical protein BDN72DRAFT_883737 [Pluteus cervinus]